MGDYWFADILRSLTIVLCLYSTLMVFYTIVLYYKRTTMEIKNYLPFMTDLMLHIYLAGIASVCINVFCAVEMYNRFNLPLTWRSPLLLGAFLLFAVSQYRVSLNQSKALEKRRRQIKEAEEKVKLEELPGKGTDL